MHGSIGIEQPAAGVAHLLRAEDDEARDFSEASETDEKSSSVANRHSGGQADSSSMDSSSCSNEVNKSINPAVLFHSLTVSERCVCATLACSCFVMYVLPGELLSNICGLLYLFRSLYEQASCLLCAVLLKTGSQ